MEMRQKMELIQQIRAMEAIPVNRKKLVNLTETAGYGLLNEMSIAEVRMERDIDRYGNIIKGSWEEIDGSWRRNGI